MLPDYEYALNYVLWGRWDDLFTLMIRTRDDMLGKKIQLFLHAYYYSSKETEIIDTHDDLLFYIDHAIESSPAQNFTMRV
ncbi:YhdB family protein [Pseudogracilibacillus sp. SO30301A]|uniref:YhdB family protein n=1 Tax=Pseudogracilibacillus sp. SO30301A TaxID=3098291 RepID=UPI00300E527A